MTPESQRPVDKHRPLLTPRRIELLRLRANGYSNSEVARMKNRSVENIIKTMGIIQRRLGARTATQAVAIALKRQILDVDDVELPALDPPRTRGPLKRSGAQRKAAGT
jgi:DNA-binding NarL/FixJ family response regulator